MRFILALNTMHHLNFLREKYQKIKNVNLDTHATLLSKPICFGGPDLKTRKAQIEFLEKIHTFLKINIFKEEEMTSIEESDANITASRVMIAAVLYVKQQIYQTYALRSPRKSVLYSLLEDDLGISDENYLDEEDEEICILAAKRIVMHSIGDLDQVNRTLKKAGVKALSEKDWSNFQDFLISKAISKTKINPYANYPVTNITQKLFGVAGSYTGAAIGYVSGEVLSHSVNALPAKTKFTALLGSTLFVFGSVGPAGVALFAPTITQRLISIFCSISLAHICGISMKFIGQGMGIIIGIPLDLAYKLILATYKTISAQHFSNKNPPLTGIRLYDGATVLSGIPLEATPEDKLPVEYQKIKVDVRDGQLYLNDQLVDISKTGMQLSKKSLESLEMKLQSPPDFEDGEWDIFNAVEADKNHESGTFIY